MNRMKINLVEDKLFKIYKTENMKTAKTKQPGSKESTSAQLGKQGVDKAPGEEKDKKSTLTDRDLKGKQVDEDPSTEEGKPLEQF